MRANDVNNLNHNLRNFGSKEGRFRSTGAPEAGNRGRLQGACKEREEGLLLVLHAAAAPLAASAAAGSNRPMLTISI
jgi:hypothetical protein